ncbi:MAG TPA: twin-arginine translocase TatA/TatE family subunit, partial [Bryobacteraceae bacterium]|nr:twin-arginine translocase TatA/TatE family subunit [Bryobacteraceae bacterium]
MGSLGWQETIVIFVLALLLFGPKKLPELGKNLAKAIGEFRRASSELKDTWQREMTAIERETEEIKKETQSAVESTYDYPDSSY